jgi:hypothetical protein
MRSEGEMGMKKTSFDKRVAILADYWYTYQQEEDEKEFFEFHDLGLPLAYMLDYGFIDKRYVENHPAEELIHETFELLLKHWGKPEDVGYEDLDEIVGAQESGEDIARRIIAAALENNKK